MVWWSIDRLFLLGVRSLFLLRVAHSLECKVPQATHSSGTTCQTNANFRKYKEGTVNRPRRKVRPPVKQTTMRHQILHLLPFSVIFAPFFWQSPPAAPKFTWLRRVFSFRTAANLAPSDCSQTAPGLGSTREPPKRAAGCGGGGGAGCRRRWGGRCRRSRSRRGRVHTQYVHTWHLKKPIVVFDDFKNKQKGPWSSSTYFKVTPDT